jgi:hypothetical protein
VAEKIRDHCIDMDCVCAEFKCLTVKNFTNQELFTKITILKMLKFPVTTCWGTWLRYANFIVENYKKIINFFESVDMPNNIRISQIIKKMKSQKFNLQEIPTIKISIFIVDSIHKL